MRPWQKLTLVSFTFVGILYFAPVFYAHVQPRRFAGVYECGGIVCGCGYEVFDSIDATGCYELVPGHHDKKLRYTLSKQQPGEWIAMRGGTNACRFRFDGRDLYRTFPNRTNWFKLEKVYNPWRIWIPEMLGD